MQNFKFLFSYDNKFAWEFGIPTILKNLSPFSFANAHPSAITPNQTWVTPKSTSLS